MAGLELSCRGIRTSNDDLGLRHAVRLDKMIERGGVSQREMDATMGDWRAKSRMVRAMNAVSSFGKEERVGHASVVPCGGA
jgi:hypothetical protein